MYSNYSLGGINEEMAGVFFVRSGQADPRLGLTRWVSRCERIDTSNSWLRLSPVMIGILPYSRQTPEDQKERKKGKRQTCVLRSVWPGLFHVYICITSRDIIHFPHIPTTRVKHANSATSICNVNSNNTSPTPPTPPGCAASGTWGVQSPSPSPVRRGWGTAG